MSETRRFSDYSLASKSISKR